MRGKQLLDLGTRYLDLQSGKNWLGPSSQVRSILEESFRPIDALGPDKNVSEAVLKDIVNR
jgi:hypothetical protein